MPSNTQFIRQAILHYEDSVMKRQSITHIVRACSILAKSQYRKRHDNVGTYLHWLLCKKHHLQCSDKRYTHIHTHARTHTPQSVQGNNEYKILWDFIIQTDKVIESRLPDTVCINKQKRVSDYCLCNPWGPKYSYQITEKNWQVPGLNNRITERLESQGSGHTGSYRCCRREQVMSKRIHQYIK